MASGGEASLPPAPAPVQRNAEPVLRRSILKPVKGSQDLAPSERTPRHTKFSDQVADLSKRLVFSDAAIMDLSSAVCSYESARENSSQLFRIHNMGIDRSRKKQLVGRHDNRGSGNRHLPCHLTQPPPRSTELVSVPGEPYGQGATGGHISWKQNPLQKDASIKGEPSAAEKPSAAEEPSAAELTLLTSPEPKNFMEQLEKGAKPFHLTGRESMILLDNNTMFKKVLQSRYPQPPDQYQVARPPAVRRPLAVRKGHKRWLDLPKPIELSARLSWECRSITSFSHMPSCDDLSQNSSYTSVQTPRQEYFNIMREWGNRWNLHVRLKEIGTDQTILQDMECVSDRTRMQAVAAVSVLAENEAAFPLRPKKELVETLFPSKQKVPAWKERRVSDDLIKAVQRLLYDSAVLVRVPSAVTLYCLDQQNDQTEHMLHLALIEGMEVERGLHSVLELGEAVNKAKRSERWAAVQCLACAGVVSTPIITELLSHLLDSHSPAKQERAAQLLAKESTKTNLVHSMVGDQLNSSGWQERRVACNVLPMLHNSINKDMCTKLLQLTWEDWSPEVQHAAAKALGRTSHGKMIHDDIAVRLTHDSVMVRQDAIKKLHSLHVMTSKLLPMFLACFSDEHLSVRMEAVALAESLKLAHPQIIAALKEQLKNTASSWMLKTSALKAFAGINYCDEELVELLIWAVRFEKGAEVRAECCRTIAQLGLSDEKVIKTLKDLVTVEDVEMVVEAAMKTLTHLGHSGEVKDSMMEDVCEAVKRLGTKDVLISDMMAAEHKDLTAYGVKRPTQQLTIRDYLDDRQRFLMYGGVDEVRSNHRHKKANTWTPDRATIDNQLNKMKTRVRLASFSTLSTGSSITQQ